MSTKTDIVRKEIHEFLKSKGTGVEVRQSELTKYLKANSVVDVTDGIIRGIYNKMVGIGGIYKKIPDVKIHKKEDGSVYYFYEKDNLNFPDDTTIGKLKQSTIEFEELLKKNGLWNISILDLPFEQRRPYLQYMEKFEELRDMFVTN